MAIESIPSFFIFCKSSLSFSVSSGLMISKTSLVSPKTYLLPSTKSWASYWFGSTRKAGMVTLSLASITVSYRTPGLTMFKANKSGRDWSPICNKSLKPSVVTNAHLAPFLSKSALVATVVPNLMEEMQEVSNFSDLEICLPVTFSRTLLIPSMFASL